MKVMIVVGARPNFMKAAPILRALAGHNRRLGAESAEQQKIHVTLVHTGQHYDARMSDAFFEDLNLPQPDVFLGVGSESHAAQTAEIMKRFEPVVEEHRPDIVVVVGDVNSTIACALVAAKISYGMQRPLIAHVEAGLRSFDRSMPEEINRILTDHLSDILLVSEESGLRNLEKEGIAHERVFFVGNTMIDSLLAWREKAAQSPILEHLQLRTAGEEKAAAYALLTLHRPANVDDGGAFREILDGLKKLAEKMPVIFPAHPRTQKQIQQAGLEKYFIRVDDGNKGNRCGIIVLDPLGYLDFLCLMQHARLIITDSGGIQEESTALGVACVTVRENTERPVTIECGSNVLAGVRGEGIRNAVERQLQRKAKTSLPRLWDGKAAERIVEILARSAAKPELAKKQALA
jgi:UDP-N-acetylglucosamine 2-epimerase (non-hydrolysing)